MSSTVKYFDSGDVKSFLKWPFCDQRNAFEKEFASYLGTFMLCHILQQNSAQSLGAGFKGRKVGTFGDFSVFPLTKNMINCGDGFLMTNNEALYTQARESLSQERGGVIAGVKDIQVVLSYGLEQMIRQLNYARVGKRKHR